MRMADPTLREVVSPGLEISSGRGNTLEVRPRWKSTFAFTTKSHLAVMVPAWLLSMIAGGIKPSLSIFMGFIFDDIAHYVAETSNYSLLIRNISKWCIALTGLGLAACLVNGGFFALCLIFGELQAKNARERLFAGLLKREMQWYDLRKDGISPVLIRIQT